MVMEGRLADLMVMTAPQIYCKYITINSKGRKMLFVRMQKALYRMLKSVLLFYWKLVDNLKKIGCEINLYDPCVMNKKVGGSQLTITWHVDDLKVSHKDPYEVTKIIEYLQEIYGDKMTA